MTVRHTTTNRRRLDRKRLINKHVIGNNDGLLIVYIPSKHERDDEVPARAHPCTHAYHTPAAPQAGEQTNIAILMRMSRVPYVGVKLSNERGEVVVLEVLGQHHLGEFGIVPHYKTAPQHLTLLSRGSGQHVLRKVQVSVLAPAVRARELIWTPSRPRIPREKRHTCLQLRTKIQCCLSLPRRPSRTCTQEACTTSSCKVSCLRSVACFA